MADNIIELRHISKVYSDNGFKAVDDFNLEVKRGEFVTFLGPSLRRKKIFASNVM